MEQLSQTVQSHRMTISNVMESTSSTAEPAQTLERGSTESELFRSIGNRYFDRLNYADDRDNRTEDIIQNGMLYNEIEIAHFPVRNSTRTLTETTEMSSLSTESQGTEPTYPQFYIDQFTSNNVDNSSSTTEHQTLSNLYEMDLICPMAQKVVLLAAEKLTIFAHLFQILLSTTLLKGIFRFVLSVVIRIGKMME
ncbi:hypothetical protein HHX47_DHR2001179 [Lentinula edodes]|nr:hypothetical protein HHX47_DHR2001179 [Lentinula edodes]